MFPQWNPRFKCLFPSSPADMESKQFQTFGTPGWLSFAPGPKVEWIPRDGVPEEVQIVIDERMCCSTLFRVERLSKTKFVVADMLYLNGKYVWKTHSFAQRSRWMSALLAEFHTKELGELICKEEIVDPVIRGWEYYPSTSPGQGWFVALPPMIPTKWHPTESPDIWVNSAGNKLEVRSLELLKKLRKQPVLQSRVLSGIVEILP
jgi:hypothetical protein